MEGTVQTKRKTTKGTPSLVMLRGKDALTIATPFQKLPETQPIKTKQNQKYAKETVCV